MEPEVTIESSFLRLTLPSTVTRQVKRIGPLGLVVLLHIALLYGLQGGLPHQTTHAVPQEIFATFITPDSPPDMPKPRATAPKTVPVIQKAVISPVVAPIINAEPSALAITTAPTEPSPAAVVPAVSAPPAPSVSVKPRTITTGIEYIQAPSPDYPSVSKRMGEQGKVILRVLVDEKGRPERIEIQQSSGSVRLDDAARQAVSRALFKPFIDDGNAAPAFAIVPITFQLDS